MTSAGRVSFLIPVVSEDKADSWAPDLIIASWGLVFKKDVIFYSVSSCRFDSTSRLLCFNIFFWTAMIYCPFCNELNNRYFGIMRFSAFLALMFLSFWQNSMAQRDENSASSALAERYYEIGLELRDLDYSEAITAFRKSRAYAIIDGLGKAQIRAEYMLSECFQDNGELDSALLYINYALKEVDNIEPDYLSMLLGTKGNIFAQMASYDSAMFYHKKALELTIFDDGEGLAYELMNYASVLFYVGEVEAARDHYNQALKIAIDSSYEDVISLVLRNKIILEYDINKELNQKELDLLLALTEKASGLSKVILLQNIATILIKEKDFEKAKPFLSQLDLSDTSLGPAIVSNNLYLFGIYYHEYGKPREALSYFRRFNTYPKNPKTIYASKRLGEIFALLGMADSSKYYYDKAWELNTESSSNRIKQDLIKSESFLNVIQAQADLAKSELEGLILRDKIIQQRWWIVVSILVASVFLLALILFKKGLRETKRLKELELTNQRARISEMGLRLSQKNELLNELEKQFAKEHVGNDEKLAVWKDEVRNNLRKAVNANRDWENLTHYFEDQYAGFYSKLKQDHPSLTDKDLRLCTLAKMRMSVKEMAKVLGLSVESVKSNRYRLRKKLAIEGEVSLSDYLAEYN